MTHSQVPSAPQDDLADLLAKETINRMVTAANNFVRHRVMHNHVTNPLEGLKLPFKPLADRIREVGKKLAGIPDAKADGWFDGDGDVPAVVESSAQPPVAESRMAESVAPVGVGCECEGGGESVSLDAVMRAIKAKKHRVSTLSAELGVSPESLGQVIARPTSGLQIAAGGWIQVRDD